jgi:hypothetical protein
MTVLLLTACVRPAPGVASLARSDPGERLADYGTALRYWLEHWSEQYRGLVLVDNSGADLRALHLAAAGAPGPVEILSFVDDPLPAGMHYGWGELGIVDHALERSTLLRGAGRFAKITGRLWFPRLPGLLRCTAGDDAVVDCRANLGKRHQRMPFVASQLMVFDQDFYRRRLLGLRADMRPVYGSNYLEHVLLARLDALVGEHRIRWRFPFNVEPRGVGGHSGRSYRRPAAIATSVVRGAARRIAPALWI